MTSQRIRLLRENYQGFSEFKNELATLQESIRDKDHHHYQRSGDAGICGRKDGQGEGETDGTSDELLSIAAVHELERLFAVPKRERDLQRCAELCSPLGFFQRLTAYQSTELFRVADLFHVPAGSYVERVGDPVGFVYVVILGIIAVEQECPDIGNRMAFMNTIVDGKVFGDGWDAVSNDGVRHASTVAQEESLVIRISTPDYQLAMRGNTIVPPEDVQPILNSHLPFLDGVGEHELAMLAMPGHGLTWQVLEGHGLP